MKRRDFRSLARENRRYERLASVLAREESRKTAKQAGVPQADEFRFETVAVETTRGVASVAIIHDTEDRSFDVVCSRHWLIYDHGYRTDHAPADILRARQSAAHRAAQHADECNVVDGGETR